MISSMLANLPNGALTIMQRLRDRGHRALLAGGCVRDLLLDRTPKDYDIATDADPKRVMQLFEHTVPVGAQFGVVLVLQNDRTYEVATFRKDHAYPDGRHPEKVTFSDEKEDALRRDFTINGLFYDPVERTILDYVGGEADLRARVLRAIGRAEDRFREDHLRIMRAVRFTPRFGLNMDPETREAAALLAPLSVEVSAERLRDEIKKIVSEGPPDEAIELMRELGVLHYVFPEIEAMIGVRQPEQFHPEGDVYTHTLLALRLLEKPSVTLAMGTLLHDIGKPPTFQIKERIRFDGHCEVGAEMADRLLRRLKFPNEERERICDLVRHHLKFKDVKNMRESTLKRFLRMDHFDEHLEMHRVDCLASHADLTLHAFCSEKLRAFTREQIRPPRLITGDDLIGLGLDPGPVFKQVLEEVETAQLEGRLSTREDALSFVRLEILPRLQ